ncbi:thermosome subunit beta [Haloplanus ruber]|uniref:Thermosome subunit beta n=1 Tax=Haloplanus ruber TaxID=869892 RepID=A0ABD6D243_9EURY|nr:thermosome subunit beta [Haloplanus ruber]
MAGLETIANVVDRVDGEDAVDRNLSAGVALGEMLRTTLGPMGSDKMLVGGGEVLLTNKGSSIVERMEIESPAATLVADIARAQSGELGDGSTAAVILAGALLDEATSLLDDGFHPRTVIEGYTRAAARARSQLDAHTAAVSMDTATRRAVVETTVTGRWDDERTAFLADLVVQSHEAIRDGDRPREDRLTLHAVPGADTEASELLDGLVIDTDRSSTALSDVPSPVPSRVDGAVVAVVDDELTIPTPESAPRYAVDDVDDLERAQAFESETYERYVDTLDAHGVDVLFCQKAVDDRLRTLLARQGVLVFERTRQDEVHKLERTTGARPVLDLDDLDRTAVGRADAVERRQVGDTPFVLVCDASATHRSLLLRGGTAHVATETERIVADGLTVLETAAEHPGLVPGGGAVEVGLARDLRSHARTVPDREAFAVSAFADAIETIPAALARNAGMRPVDALLELRRRHDAGETTAGVDATAGDVCDAVAVGLLEPARVKERMIANAAQAATFLLRVDDVIETDEPLHDEGEGHDHDHGTGGGGVQRSTGGYPWAIGH